MNPIEILVFETRNGFFKARVRWMEGCKQCTGYTGRHHAPEDAASVAVRQWHAAELSRRFSGSSYSSHCGKGVPS